MKRFGLLLFVLALVGIAAAPARADSYLPQIGGLGGAQYRERCPQGQVLNGFELRAGDDIDAIRAVCVTPSSPTAVSAPPLSNGRGAGWHGGGGGSLQRLLCPPVTPVVKAIKVGYDGIDTVSLDWVDIYCGSVDKSQVPNALPSNQFHAPVQGCTSFWVPLGGTQPWNCASLDSKQQTCPAGDVAIGMHGHSGALVDAMGLICGAAPVFRPSAPAMGYVPDLTPAQKLQKALRGAKVVGQVQSSSIDVARALNPQPLPPGHVPEGADVGAIVLTAGKGQSTGAAQPPRGSGTDWLYAVDARGHLWKFKQTGHALSKAKREDGDWGGFVSVIVSGKAGGDLVVYGLQANGDLIWRRIGGIASGIDTAAAPLRQAAKPVGNGWDSFKNVFSTGEGVVYGVAPNGDLVWYRQANNQDGNATPQWQSRVVGTGWGSFKHLFSPGHGVIYAVKPDGTLLWYRHRGYLTGAGIDQPGAWEGPKKVGSGWQDFKQVFAAHDGHIYAVNAAGELLYYHHKGWQTGSVDWDTPVELADGWGKYVDVFAAIRGKKHLPVVR